MSECACACACACVSEREKQRRYSHPCLPSLFKCDINSEYWGKVQITISGISLNSPLSCGAHSWTVTLPVF